MHFRSVLVVPDRYHFANLTATVAPWQRCLAGGDSEAGGGNAGRVVLRQHAEWAVSQQCREGAHKLVKLTRCRRGGCAGVPAGASNCTSGAAGLDRCVVLNGLVYLKKLLESVRRQRAALVQ